MPKRWFCAALAAACATGSPKPTGAPSGASESQAKLAALKPARESTVTVPGAGLLRLNPSPLPMALVTACRGNPGAAAEEPLAAELSAAR